MRKIFLYLFCLTAILSISSCLDKYSEELMMNTPVYLDYATLRSSVKQTDARDLVHPGKICFKDQYLLIVEYHEGIHVIDVSNPSNPQNKTFIEVPGCVDIAVKDNALYADSYVDLVTIDLSDINHPKETNRIKNAFSYTVPAADNENIPYAPVDQDKGVVVSWQAKREKRSLDRNPYPTYPVNYYVYTNNYTMSASDGGASGGTVSTFGKSGSMARFGLYGNYLYIVNNSNYMLSMFNVENSNTPVSEGSIYISGNVETLFVYDSHLFFGTSSGMLVFDLKIPNTPVYVQTYWHITSCDPVVVQNGYAYITLRAGTACQNTNVNRLDIVKYSDDYQQFDLVYSYNLIQPYGLGIDGNLLFICDGSAGLKVLDVTDKTQLRAVASFPNIQTYDVIPADGYLFMIGDDGFYLYDYSDINNIHAIGHIPVVKQ